MSAATEARAEQWKKDDARFRPDAAKVYRSMRDSGPATAIELADRVFPATTDPGDPSYEALRKRAYRRVIDSIVWMRHHGVTTSAVPSDAGTVFHLGAVAAAVSPLRPLTLFDDPDVGRIRAQNEPTKPVTDNLSQPGGMSDAMDVWHGSD